MVSLKTRLNSKSVPRAILVHAPMLWTFTYVGDSHLLIFNLFFLADNYYQHTTSLLVFSVDIIMMYMLVYA